MNALKERVRVSEITAGVEVVTMRAYLGGFVSIIHGGRLDGTEDVGEDQDALHERHCRRARMAAWVCDRRLARGRFAV